MSDDLAELSLLDRLDPANTEGLTACAGGSLAATAAPATEAAVVATIRQVHDPEIPVNLYDLGLIYRIDIARTGDVVIVMTLTAPSCPVAGELPKMVADAVAACPGTGVVRVTLTWEPRWATAMMSDDARLALGLEG